MPKENQENDKPIIQGGPEDELENENNENADGEQDEGSKGKKEPVYVTQDQLQEFQSRQDRILTMLDGLTKKPQGDNNPPPRPSSREAKIAGMSQEEFEQVFWDNPAEALERYKDTILNEVKTETNKMTGQQQFWSEFYNENDDLKEDKDLVQLVLNQNIGTLADLPVPEAKTQLADLTRKRILRYGGGENKTNGGGKKAFAEGSEHRIPKEKQKEPERPKTLGELIRARKAARRGGKAMAS